MAQIDALIRETVTGCVTEVTSGTHGGTLERLRVTQGSLLNTGFGREMLADDGASPVRWDNLAHIPGKELTKWGPLTIQVCGLLSADRLIGGASLATLSHDVFYQHALGRRYAAVGTTVAGVGATTTTITLASGTGRKAGELVAIETATGLYEVRSIVSVSGADIVVSPALATAPTTNGLVVRGVRTFVMAETHNTTLTLEQRLVVHGGTSLEFRCLGAFRESVTFTFGDFGKVMTCAMTGAAIDVQGPTALSSPAWALGSAPAADDMDTPLTFVGQLLVDGVNARFEPSSFKVAVAANADPIGDGANASGIGGFLDTSGRDNGMSVSGEFTIRIDSAEVSSFDAGTVRHLMMVVDPNRGAATTTMAVLEVPRFQVTERPIPVSIGAGRTGYTIKWKALRDTKTAASDTAENNDLARTPIRWGLV
jgi:hypothetical protein